jgi:transcriptional regulator of arginine metabolism
MSLRVAAPQTKAARQSVITELLGRIPVHSQTELAELLVTQGISVTQATLSRDLDEIGAERLRGTGGGFTYAVRADGGVREGTRPPGSRAGAATAAQSRLIRMAADLLVSVRHSGNIVVARTPPGGAHLLAGAIDHAELDTIIGTVAGDDTVLCVCRDADGAPSVAAQLLDLTERASSRTTQ